MLVSRGKEGITMNLLWMLDEVPTSDSSLVDPDSINQLWETLYPILNTVIWIIVAALGVVLVIKGITTALAVVKAADEPQVRQEKIGAFKYLAIGLGIAIIVLSLATVIVDLVLKNANAGDLPTTFLF